MKKMELLTMLMESHAILSEMGKTISDYVHYMESSYKGTLDKDVILRAYMEGFRRISKELSAFNAFSDSERSEECKSNN